MVFACDNSIAKCASKISNLWHGHFNNNNIIYLCLNIDTRCVTVNVEYLTYFML